MAAKSAPLSGLTTTPLDMLYYWEQNHPEQIYLRQPVNRKWKDYTWKTFAKQVRIVTGWIKSRHLPAGSRIGIQAKNCAEWLIADMAIMMSGHISVPLYPGQSPDDLRYIIEHGDIKLIFAGRLDQPEWLQQALIETCHTIGMSGCALETDFSLDEILTTGTPYKDSPRPGPEQVFTLMYTSGTTGNPKGVMHTYGGVAFVCSRVVKVFNVDSRDRYLSYLPLSHAAERVIVEMASIYSGARVHFAENIDTFLDDLKNTRPTLFFSVPRLWQKFKMGIEEKIPPKRLRMILRIPVLSQLLSKQILKGLGLDKARICLSGAASIPKDLLQWFSRLGLDIREGYGMTENLAYGTFSQGGKPLFGSVGTTMPGCEIKFNEQGEVMFRSPAVMRGYYREPEKTSEVLKDGWYCTGDVGHIDDDGSLFLTGRIKDHFKTSKGKFVAPVPIEDRLSTHNAIEQLCLMGQDMISPVLVVSLSDSGQLLEKGLLQQELETEVEQVNDNLMPHERIGKVYITREQWTVDNGLVTPTMKIKRHQLEQHYKGWIESRAIVQEMVVWD
ncbi:AMP-binding protein [Parendozoicomonas sp. Alg238-R29]|uniref:AMP-binding protein n=1 Tax=Parendozoicomonas sp. Alg238-R29 TaxID=2993446 RepID=UPI00248ED2D3|nr:AMP-binding protein [Parendozoicomonas sp. Alg238-R29]